MLRGLNPPILSLSLRPNFQLNTKNKFDNTSIETGTTVTINNKTLNQWNAALYRDMSLFSETQGIPSENDN